MSVKSFEEEITPKLKWERVEDIPNFPLESYDEVKKKLSTYEYSIGIDDVIAMDATKWLYSLEYASFFTLMTWIPFIIAVVAIVLAFVLGNYWLLFGFVISLVAAFVLAIPTMPFRRFLTIVAVVIFFIFLYGLWRGNETITYLSAFFVFPFFIARYSFTMARGKLRRVALDSQKIFIYFYQKRN